MPEPFRCLPADALVVGYDFSTGGVKALAFDLTGHAVAEVRLPTDLWTDGGVSELNLMQLEGQARAATRALATALPENKHTQWIASGISATHHTSGRIDRRGNQVRRAICWNDQTLAAYHTEGLQRLGGQERAKEITGGPWAVRYSLSHLVKDQHTLNESDWERTARILSHGSLVAGYLTARFDCTSVSAAASTGIMDLRTNEWRKEILEALAKPEQRSQAWRCFPRIVDDMSEPVGSLSESVALDAHLPAGIRPLVFPTLDDQAAGLIGGGAVEAGHVAIILGNSAVVNSSSSLLPQTGTLDAMKLNWGPYLWMRCYSNGALFVDTVAGKEWYRLEAAAATVPPLCNGTSVLPFLLSEPSAGVTQPAVRWSPAEPAERSIRIRACLESLAFLLARGVKEHEAAGQIVSRITISGGMARSNLMCQILASVLNRPLERLASDEGPALGAAVVALAGMESYLRKRQGIAEPYTATDAVAAMVKFRDRVSPVSTWAVEYAKGMAAFERRLQDVRK